MIKYLNTYGLILYASIQFAAPYAQAQTLDYTLMNDLFGEAVTTSANGSPQTQSDVALNMHIVTDEQIQKMGASSIPEAIRFIPGVEVRQHTFAQHEVSIRGYNQKTSERILVLVNGRQVYTDFYGQVIWDNIPVEMTDIKQIEIVKGPNTALFGFNAVSGVINIITYNPLYDTKKSANVTGGSHGLRGASGSYIDQINDNLGIRLSGRSSEVDRDFKDPNNAAYKVHDPKTESISLDTWAQLTETLQGQIEITHNDHRRNEEIVTDSFTSTETKTRSLRGRLISDNDYGITELDMYHNHTRTDMEFHLANGNAILDIDNSISVAKLSHTFHPFRDDHIFRLAGEYRSASNNFATATAPLDKEDLTYDIWSGSALWDWSINSKLRSSFAVRYDNFKLEPESGDFIADGIIGVANPSQNHDYYQKREEFSYNAGLTYKHDPYNTFRLTTARGVDLPSFTEFGVQFFSGPGTSQAFGSFGQPNTDTSTTTNYELGYEHSFRNIDATFETALFYQYNDEMQAPDAVLNTVNLGAPIGNTDIGEFYNIGDSEMAGIEIGVHGKMQDWHWGANYTYIHISDDLRNQQNSAALSNTITYEDSVANHIINTSLGYEGMNWHVGIDAQYKSAFKQAYDNSPTLNSHFGLKTVDAHVVLNANYTYHINDQADFTLVGYNLLGQQQTANFDAEPIIFARFSYEF